MQVVSISLVYMMVLFFVTVYRLLSGYVKMKKLFASSVTETVVSEQNQKYV